MPGQDQYIAIPDGSYVHIPGDATSEQLSALREKLSGFANPYSESSAAARPPVATPSSWQQPKDPYSGQSYGRAVPPAMATQTADVDRAIGTGGQMQNRTITPVSDATAAIMPAVGMGEAIAEKGVGPVLGTIGRGMAKTAAGTAVGSGVGGALGSIAGHPKEGAEIGATIGGIATPFLPNRVLSSAPYGLSRLFLTNEEMAGERAAMKMAQRNADITAGLREPPPSAEDQIQQMLEETFLSGKPHAQKVSSLPVGPTYRPESGGSALGNIGGESVAGTRPRSLVLTPEEAASEEQMQKIAKTRASERGMQFAAGMTPREGRSAPRGPARMESAEPSGPREIIHFSSEGAPLGQIGSPRINFMTDKMGLNWAERNGVRVTIPSSVPESMVQDYAAQKLDEQEAMQKSYGRVQ